ncbi:juvenile hormone-binding protein-like isoform X2 [Anticarsia gemmatalis]|uniref:juvenile hormone-binding protein-like isoform X2 n=1 Tax=Anticarsia gemmatalis TaxID=129554 RepID=UPI003F7659D5
MDFKSFLLLAFALVSANGQALFEPCYKDDIKCLSTALEDFLSKTYGGVANYSLEAIDPYVISSLEVVADENMGLVFNFKNARLTGMKNMKILDYKMDTAKQTVLLKMKVNLEVNSDFQIGLTKSSRTLSGPYSASAIVHETISYSYKLFTVNGEDYYELGPETSICEIVEEPKVTLGAELQQQVASDQDAVSLKPQWEANKVALRKKTLCKLANSAFVTVIQNLRSLAKIVPKKNFFKDI